MFSRNTSECIEGWMFNADRRHTYSVNRLNGEEKEREKKTHKTYTHKLCISLSTRSKTKSHLGDEEEEEERKSLSGCSYLKTFTSKNMHCNIIFLASLLFSRY